MIKIEKDLNDVPSVLKNDAREEAFKKNIEVSNYLHGKGLYKSPTVQDKLNEIYHFKCVYCERDISDDDKHIEHYRPKSRYYWLAYSWDNLLLCCSRCNKAKGDKFETIHCSMLYGNEEFCDVHTLGEYYDGQEIPKFINPEREDILDELFFDRDGKIFSDNIRVTYTIDEIKLNRNELVEKRIKIVNSFIKRVERHYWNCKNQNFSDFSMFDSDIEELIEECHRENDFYAFRYFVRNNIELFFEDKILKSILNNKIKEYINA